MGAGDYPAGAYNDPRAPYNEELTKEKDYFVSTTISFTLKGTDRMDVKEKAKATIEVFKLIRHIINFNIDELEIVEE
jgi:hypothetical protein